MVLKMKRRTINRLITGERLPLGGSTQLKQVWPLVFMRDKLYDGRPFRTLNVIDEGNREAFRIECETYISSNWLVRAMNQRVEVYGPPEAIRMDNVLNAIGVAQNEQAHSWLSKQPKKTASPRCFAQWSLPRFTQGVDSP